MSDTSIHRTYLSSLVAIPHLCYLHAYTYTYIHTIAPFTFLCRTSNIFLIKCIYANFVTEYKTGYTALQMIPPLK